MGTEPPPLTEVTVTPSRTGELVLSTPIAAYFAVVFVASNWTFRRVRPSGNDARCSRRAWTRSPAGSYTALAPSTRMSVKFGMSEPVLLSSTGRTPDGSFTPVMQVF